MKTGLISGIVPEDESTWRDKTFITVDIEWAADETIQDLVGLIRGSGAQVTLFWTHPTPLLESMRADAGIELGIHPNFNHLLDGGNAAKPPDALSVIKECLAFAPGATSVRSHCVTDSSRLTGHFHRLGLHHVCNTFLPAPAGLNNRPWRTWPRELVQVPSAWADDVHCLSGWPFRPSEFLAMPGLRVFNFHPVTTLLNISDISQYEAARADYHHHDRLLARRNRGPGVRTFLEDLLHALA